MRPVNLIPPEERRGSTAPSRAGILSYLVIGVLAVVLVAVSAIVLLGNKVDDKQAEADSLEAQAIEAEARAEGLASYVSFQQMRESRAATIDSLAKSRFDWERIIRELSLVIPKQVWLSNLTGTVSPEVQIDDGAAISLRTSVPGPALELVGCARSQPAIAKLIASLHDIDGVTRVTAANGIKSDTAQDSTSTGGGSDQIDTGGDCPPSAPGFQVVAAFDAVPAIGADVPPAAPPADGTAPTSSSSTSTDTTSTTSEQKSVNDAKAKAEKATNLVPGG
jgi:Tfp pilus assembly protein PilN